MGKSKGKIKLKDLLQIPCTFDDYKLKKTTGEMVVCFSVAKEKVDLAKPLINEVDEKFVLILCKASDMDAIGENISFDPEDLNA